MLRRVHGLRYAVFVGKLHSSSSSSVLSNYQINCLHVSANIVWILWKHIMTGGNGRRTRHYSSLLYLFVTLYIYYIVMMGLGLVTAIYMIFGTVFIVCTLGVSWATYNNRLHGPSLAIGVQSSERCDKLYWKRTTK